MSGTGTVNSQSLRLEDSSPFNPDGTRASRADEQPAAAVTPVSALSPSDAGSVNIISDETLVSLQEGCIPHSAVSYDALLKKSIMLLKEKICLEDENKKLRARNESLKQTNKTIRETSVRLHAKAEQEEEYISNTLLKRIQKLKNDKEALALKYEQEEEFLTNDLTRKLSQLQNERDELAGQIEAEQGWVVDTLLVKIRKLEAEISANHAALEQLRREKVDLENALEHEQEALFNTLGKQMDKLEAEKRSLVFVPLIHVGVLTLAMSGYTTRCELMLRICYWAL
ncbi:unnamed protein product [Gongylonema pulchrum]|uniref:Coiled-coil domain-containing protein 6 n=1 Tax=Gongylonema pulchrum TaxID=637853 RepID=A0A183DRE4_9BILA|nr:unnamed protein product [Gongylonema pulchrum]